MADDVTRPSYEVLAALVVSLREELVAARAEVARAQERIACCATFGVSGMASFLVSMSDMR